MTDLLEDSYSLQERERKVREGLDHILTLIGDSSYIWSQGRWISTYIRTDSGKEQKFRLVYSKEEALAYYKAANHVDCRIRAYHILDNIEPFLLLVDIDRENFNTTEEFELAVTNTYNNFYKVLGARPMQLWTGNGYHFIQRQFAIILDNQERFKEFYKPSSMFLRYEERLLTNGKADHVHMNSISFGNCLLRIPWSLNSNQVHFDERGRIIAIPPEAEVRVINIWDGYEPSIKKLLPDYYNYLLAEDVRNMMRETELDRKRSYYSQSKNKNKNKNKIWWVENLLNMPLHDFRKYLVRRIIPRYFINIRGLSRQEAFENTSAWLNGCNLIHKLDFNPTKEIDRALNNVKGYLPQGRESLKRELPPLFQLLKDEGVMY